MQQGIDAKPGVEPVIEMEPGHECVARLGTQETLVLWRPGSGERYHLYRHDTARRVDELLGVYDSAASALADAQRFELS